MTYVTKHMYVLVFDFEYLPVLAYFMRFISSTWAVIVKLHM